MAKNNKLEITGQKAPKGSPKPSDPDAGSDYKKGGKVKAPKKGKLPPFMMKSPKKGK